MSVNTSAEENLSSLWRQLNAKWQGDAADAFYREYVLKLQESAAQADASCRVLREEAAVLLEKLIDAARDLNP